MGFASKVFDRVGPDEISRQTFLGFIGALLIFGFVLDAVIVQKLIEFNYVPSLWQFLVLGIGLPLLGIWMASASENPILSFTGYCLVVVPFGVLLGPVIQVYLNQPHGMRIVQQSILLTGCVTGIMMLLAVALPDVFSRIGGALFVALCALLVVRVIQMFVPALQGASWIEWLSAGIFSLYIGYNWYRAMSVPSTWGNGINIALSLYLDVINLFLTILRLTGDSSD
jgi:FtsH-binding integral membrane protein